MEDILSQASRNSSWEVSGRLLEAILSQVAWNTFWKLSGGLLEATLSPGNSQEVCWNAF